jgi:hypothetical protein
MRKMRLTFVFSRGDVLIRPKFQDVLSLVGTSTYTDDSICSKCFGKEDTIMPKPTTLSLLAITHEGRRNIHSPNPNNPNPLPRPTPIVLQRTIHRDATTQHRRRLLTRQAIRDLKDQRRRSAVKVRIPSIRTSTVGKDAAVGDHHARTVMLAAGRALFAVRAQT